jgi:hypothetical protein
MTRIAMLLAGILAVLPGCASSGNVSPLVYCEPNDFYAKVLPNCAPDVHGD